MKSNRREVPVAYKLTSKEMLPKYPITMPIIRQKVNFIMAKLSSCMAPY